MKSAKERLEYYLSLDFNSKDLPAGARLINGVVFIDENDSGDFFSEVENYACSLSTAESFQIHFLTPEFKCNKLCLYVIKHHTKYLFVDLRDPSYEELYPLSQIMSNVKENAIILKLVVLVHKS